MWRFKRARQLAKLDISSSKGKTYVIQNVKHPASSDKNTNLQVITVMEGNYLGVSEWEGESAPEKMFRIQPCSDRNEDCVVTVYNSRRQWTVSEEEEENKLEVKEYPSTTSGARGGMGHDDDERLRPRFRCWRFVFEEAEPEGLKKYRIFSMDDGLPDGHNCLFLKSENAHGVRELGFTVKREGDYSQLWCLHKR